MWSSDVIQMLVRGIGESLVMSVFSTFFGYVLGIPLGVLLAVTAEDGIRPMRAVYRVLDFVINILRSRRDKGQVHIPTDDSSRGTCLNASDLLNTGDTQETSGTEETQAENTEMTGTTQEAA